MSVANIHIQQLFIFLEIVLNQIFLEKLKWEDFCTIVYFHFRKSCFKVKNVLIFSSVFFRVPSGCLLCLTIPPNSNRQFTMVGRGQAAFLFSHKRCKGVPCCATLGRLRPLLLSSSSCQIQLTKGICQLGEVT